MLLFWSTQHLVVLAALFLREILTLVMDTFGLAQAGLSFSRDDI